MNDPVIIERADLNNALRNAALMALREFTMQKSTNPFISQNHAVKLLGKGGRGKLDRAMARGQVKFHKRDPDKKLGRVMVCYEDIEKLLNNPTI